MVAVWCGKKVEYQVRNEETDPVILFDLESLGLDAQVFLNEFHTSFSQLPWDHYDVRREQLSLLHEYLSRSDQRDHLFTEYYLGRMDLGGLLQNLPPIAPETLALLHAVEPYRRRTTSRFALTKAVEGWGIERIKNSPVVQSVPSSDYRSLSREFPETTTEILEHPEFNKLLIAIGGLVEQVDEAVEALTITCWQTGIVATPYRSGSNSPEGIHQDGSDYIISALVTARDNIDGGVSRVFKEDKSTEILTVALQPGMGIFQADAGSSLWHDVTPIRVENTREGNGTRNLFGFDINVEEKV